MYLYNQHVIIKLSGLFYSQYDGKIHARANSVYQALFSPPPQEPGNKASD